MWSSCWDVGSQFVTAGDGDTCISHMFQTSREPLHMSFTSSSSSSLLDHSSKNLSTHFAFQTIRNINKNNDNDKRERNKPSIAKQRPLSFSSEVGGIHNKGMSRAPRPNANNFALSSLRAIHRLAQLAAHVEEEEARAALPER